MHNVPIYQSTISTRCLENNKDSLGVMTHIFTPVLPIIYLLSQCIGSAIVLFPFQKCAKKIESIYLRRKPIISVLLEASANTWLLRKKIHVYSERLLNYLPCMNSRDAG